MSETMGVMKDRQLQIEGFLEKVEALPQGYSEASTRTQNNETNEFNARQTDNAKDLLEKICSRQNMREAYRRVVQNKGAGGVDGMKVTELNTWLEENYEALIDRLLAGKYKPKPVRRVEIPKEEKGKTRLLGIPTVIDRMVQQAIVQVLTPIYDPGFSEHSYGFRPNRSAHDALMALKQYADAGEVWVASIDLEKFFDMVNQSKMIQLLSIKIKDGRVISLIHRFLQAGVMVAGVVQKTEQGTPQGGPLSPLLANIMLDELDKELTSRGHKFVRYADDCMIMKRTQKAAIRTLETVSKFIEGELFLKVNRDKSYVAHITDNVKYLGYGFYQHEDELKFCPHAKSITKLKDKIRKILDRSNGWALGYRIKCLQRIITGWVNYFMLTSSQAILEKVDKWIRRKIRCLYWKLRKRVRTRFKELRKLGIPRQKAWEWANTRKGYWKISASPILHKALGNKRLEDMGWPTLVPRYQKVKCQG